MIYRREIDGLRALAVLPVILFHAGFELFSGGFVGVDVFFVISGYLITTIILAELEQGKFSLINFYERRARRILPALFLVMFVCIPFAWLWLLPSDMKDFSQSLVAVSFFASNILFWRESGYFDAAAELKPLLHTWSLAVEEQYYVLFPLFLMLFWKLGKRWILLTLGLAFLASHVLAQWASYAKPAAAFYLLPTRGWELLIGAFAAFYLSQPNRKEFGKTAGEVGGWLGVVLIIYAVFAYDKTTPFPGFYALVPTLGTVLVILFATQQTTVGKFVGNKAFVGIGLISYSAYLWHQPLFAFARHWALTEPSHIILLIIFLTTLLVSYVSWKFIESPFRDRFLFSRKFIFLFSGSSTIIFVIFAIFLHSDNGNLSRRYDQAEQAIIHLGMKSYKATMQAFDLGRCFIDYAQTYQVLVDSKCISLKSTENQLTTRVMVFGDSQAAHWMAGVKDLFVTTNGYSIEQYTGTSCRSIDHSKNNTRCREFHNYFINSVIPTLGPSDIVILSSRWFEILESEGELGFVNSFESTLSALKKVGVSVVIFGNTPEFLSNPFDLIVRLGLSDDNEIHLTSVDFRHVNDLLKSSSQKFGFYYFSPSDILCQKDDPLKCLVKYEGNFLYFDAGHLSVDGSRFLFDKLGISKKILQNPTDKPRTTFNP